LSLDDRLREFVAEYGERACIVLKAIHEESSLGGRLKLGDFSIKGLKARLKSWGVEYNPTPLLLKLEKELNLIETSYRSTSSSTVPWDASKRGRRGSDGETSQNTIPCTKAMGDTRDA
jgi:hypothetical protein